MHKIILAGRNILRCAIFLMQQHGNKSITVADYFAPGDSGVQTGGVKMVPIRDTGRNV